MVVLGLVLVLLGALLAIANLGTIGILLVLVGLAAALLGRSGRRDNNIRVREMSTFDVRATSFARTERDRRRPMT